MMKNQHFKLLFGVMGFIIIILCVLLLLTVDKKPVTQETILASVNHPLDRILRSGGRNGS